MINFYEETKKNFKSCKWACVNNCGPRADWNVWGDFKSRKHAIEAGKMWAMAFRGKLEISIENNLYRVVVNY